MNKYWITTYGCQLNQSDSERIASVLESTGYSPALNEHEADLIVVNMCSVRQSAVDRVYGKIENFSKFKDKNPRLKTVLTGCILKLDKKKLERKFDEIWSKKELLKNLKNYKFKNLKTAYIPISNGCNNACTYCAVPFTRGPLVCRSPKEILKEVKNAAENGLNPIRNTISNGAREIWLLGQNVNDYKSGNINFAKLLHLVNKIPGDFKIRFMSPHPAYFTDELIDAMAKSPKIARYLNLPLQSGDNKILKAMNRPYTAQGYKNLVKKIREKMPDINLSTDIIVGFPGETKKQFEKTVKLFKELKFNIAYISKYSPRPGTAASGLKDDISIKEKKRRWKILNSLLS